MKRRNGLPKELYTIMISMMFLGGFLLLVVFGANTYQKITRISENLNSDRATLSYLFTALKNDNASDLLIIKGDTTEIRIREAEGKYDRVIYLYDGYLMEENTIYDYDISPMAATKIARNDIFEIEYIEERDLLKITTSEGTVYINTGMREVTVNE
ncbi:MAG: DUF4860 domain-containing protein [Erysipelotrichaceae bacterium]|nr:DUF4860 domain-containing protein [Erysipelotrichaceae bacterium]